MKDSSNFLKRLGVYGFSHVEPLILAALVSEDPILLIGKAGTGKTFLLNSISEAMELEHRHYNASLLSFDDLIGFPYPAADGRSVDFLPTPATIWGAESVLVDELSRCKPETQNKFFSIIHERKLQGIPLDMLRYRWAAMNPAGFGADDVDDHYEGSQPLDEALADRFAFIIEVPDWSELTQAEQDCIIDPQGEGAMSQDAGQLKKFIMDLKPVFTHNIRFPDAEAVAYVRLATTLLTEAGYRISPRRARLMVRNICALQCVNNGGRASHHLNQRKQLYKSVLTWSIPHRAWKGVVPGHIIDSVHAEASRIACTEDPEARWVSEFLLVSNTRERISMIMDRSIPQDTRSLAVFQLLAKETPARSAMFCFTLFPLINNHDILNEEALHEMAKIARGVLEVDGKLEWREGLGQKNTLHPSWSECLSVLSKLPDSAPLRKQRAKQLFLYLLTNGHEITYPEQLEEELQESFEAAKKFASMLINQR